MKPKNIFIAIVIIALIIIAAYATRHANPQVPAPGQGEQEQVACTMEAMQCPDGSYVGRTGPQCQFAACPGASASDLKTFTDASKGITFQYPEKLSTQYTTAVDWPPQVQVTNESFSCKNAGSETARAGRTESKTVNGQAYCVTTLSEGAAGSTYLQYAYAFAKDGKTAILTFTTRQPQCLNYDEPKATECQNERAAFSPDALADQIARTLVLTK